MKQWRETAAAMALLAVAFALLAAWSLVVPVFEAPDEPDHWQYARHLHDTWRLPIYSPEFLEGNSPPLYYGLVAPLATSGALPLRINWNVPIGHEDHVSGLRYHVSQRGDLGRYWNVRAARLLTCLMSLATLVFCWLAGREATGRRETGLLAAGLAAFLPQFAFRGMNVSNDALVAAGGAAATYVLVRLMRCGSTPRLCVAAAAATALAYLSKISAVFLPVPLAAAILWQPRPWSERLRHLSLFLGLVVLAVTPWSLRNLMLYGDPFASQAMLTVVPFLVDRKPLLSPYFQHAFPIRLAKSFVGTFGWMNLPLPSWIYTVFLLLGLAAGLGLVRRWTRRSLQGRLVVLLVLLSALALAVVVHINRTFSQPQGRYLFPALSAIALLVALGLEGLPGWSVAVAKATVTALAALNVFVLAAVVWPAYWGMPAREFGTPGTDLRISRMVGFDRLDGGRLVTHRPYARVVARTDLDTRDYNVLYVDLSGQCTAVPRAKGAVYFAVDGLPLGEETRTKFLWFPNGTPQRVPVALFTTARWRGRVTALRVDPFADLTQAKACRGTTIEVMRLRLSGRIEP